MSLSAAVAASTNGVMPSVPRYGFTVTASSCHGSYGPLSPAPNATPPKCPA